MSASLLVALGGALGALGRFHVGLATAGWGGGWPVGTFAVNTIGSFAIGVLAILVPRGVHPFLITGLLGGFTTYSAFSLETIRLVEGGRPGLAGLYAVATLVLCLGAAGLGVAAGRLAL